MKEWEGFFKGKRITVVGLGLLGGIGDIRFLASEGADLILTDLKSPEDLTSSLEALKEFPNIQFTLGRHEISDFQNRDLIIQAPGTPRNSPYIKAAKDAHIPVTMWAALFARFAKQEGVPIIGVTGTRGKTTTTALISEILKASGREVITGGNVSGTSLLPHLHELNKNTVVVLELDSWKLQGFREEGISPDVAVFTTFMPDHLNYYAGDMEAYFVDKANIFLNQTEEDILILGEQVAPQIAEYGYQNKIRAKTIIAGVKDCPKKWNLQIPGAHNRMNAGIAIAAAHTLGIDDEVIQPVVEGFTGVAGRLQLVREIDGVTIYNDTTATAPSATVAGLHALGNPDSKNIVLIMGGADKKLDMSELVEEIPTYVKKVIFLAGSGTDTIRDKFPGADVCDNIPDALRLAMDAADEGDTILFSPAFASFGMFKNEYDRGEQFEKAVAQL